MDVAIPSNNFLLPSNVRPSLHAQLAGLYSDLQSRHKAQKKCGQQPGSKGHGRRDYTDLPTTEEVVSLESACCPCCDLPYKELHGFETSEILEVIHVQAHRRIINRKKYKRNCRCKDNPDSHILLAPTADRLIPKCKLGISVWALLIVNKYEYQHPFYRTLEQLKNHGMSLSMGTVLFALENATRNHSCILSATGTSATT